MAKTFHIGDIVSCGAGYLMPPNGMDGVYNLLNHMTGDNLMTHQLPMAAKQMEPYLHAQFPWLIGLEPPVFDGLPELEAWLAELARAHGEELEVTAPPSSVWGEHDPIEDLHKVAPHMKVIPVVIDTSEGE